MKKNETFKVIRGKKYKTVNFELEFDYLAPMRTKALDLDMTMKAFINFCVKEFLNSGR